MFRITCLHCGRHTQNILNSADDTVALVQVFPYAIMCVCGATVVETPEGLQAMRPDRRPTQGFQVECLTCGRNQTLANGVDARTAAIQIANDVSCECGAHTDLLVLCFPALFGKGAVILMIRPLFRVWVQVNHLD